MFRRENIPDLAAFLSETAPYSVAGQRRALINLIDRGLGTRIAPTAPRDRSPATHLHEITALQISATGNSEAEAAINWFRAAHRAAPLTEKGAA